MREGGDLVASIVDLLCSTGLSGHGCASGGDTQFFCWHNFLPLTGGVPVLKWLMELTASHHTPHLPLFHAGVGTYITGPPTGGHSGAAMAAESGGAVVVAAVPSATLIYTGLSPFMVELLIYLSLTIS